MPRNFGANGGWSSETGTSFNEAAADAAEFSNGLRFADHLRYVASMRPRQMPRNFTV